MGTLSGLSITFSFFGGFNLVDTITEKPKYVAPILEEVKEVKADYTALISDAAKDADEYKERKLYKGRLSDDNAKVYKELLDRKSVLRKEMTVAINSVLGGRTLRYEMLKE